MKEEITHLSCSHPLLKWLIPLALALSLLGSAAIGRIAPTGKKAGVVQFDVVLEGIKMSGSTIERFNQLFARYWVSADFYSMAVVWQEPHGRGSWNFETFAISSDKHNFRIFDAIYPTLNQTHPKPLVDRGVFRFTSGMYETSDIRFAEPEALARRVHIGDLKVLDDPNLTVGQSLDVPVTQLQDGPKRELARLKVRSTGPRLDSMELFNADSRLLGTVQYEYKKDGEAMVLGRLTALLPEQPQRVGFQGQGMTVTLNKGSERHQVRDTETTHHQGGRICTVEYRPVTLGEKTISLPCSVEVRDGQDKRLLRSAKLMNYRLVNLDADGAWSEARQVAGNTPLDRRYQKLWVKYQNKGPTEVEPNDLDQARPLLAYFEKKLAAQEICLGERLRCLSGLIKLDRLIGDEDALERHYLLYLRTLIENGLHPMVLYGGHEPIETLMETCRYDRADRLVGRWVEEAMTHNEAEAVLQYSRSAMKKGYFWTTFRLLDRLLEKGGLSAEARFEAQALRCSALHRSDKLMEDPDGVEEPMGQWVRLSVNGPELERRFATGIKEAVRSFRGLSQATQAQALQPYADSPLPRRRLMQPDPSPLQEATVQLQGVLRQRNMTMDGVLQAESGQDRKPVPVNPGQRRNVVPRRQGRSNR